MSKDVRKRPNQFVQNYLDATKAADMAGSSNAYLGKVVHPYEAKNDSKATSFETYKKGDKRVMTVHLWEVKLTPAEQKKKEEEECAERIMRAERERREREEALRKEKANYNLKNEVETLMSLRKSVIL